VLGALAIAAGCAASDGGAATAESGATTAIDRFLLGRAAEYPADRAMQARFPRLKASQRARRDAAWQVIERVIAPVPIPGPEGRTVPRFQTWIGEDEIGPLFKRVLDRQTKEEVLARRPPTAAEIDEAFGWLAERAPSLPTFSADKLAERRADVADAGTASLGGPEQVLLSPALARHLLVHYDAVLRCLGGSFPAADAPPPSRTNFAPCVGEELPPDAVVVKAQWMPSAFQVPVTDTSGPSLTAILAGGAWPEPTRLASPTPDAIYTMRVRPGLDSRLVSLHVASKELRDWMWTTMFWSDQPGTDLGADRPATMTGPWSGYKMCAVVDYDEGDDGREDGALDPSLAAAFAATRAFGPRSWCSNPNLEGGPHNAKTNCIGCHQHAGTDLSTGTILEGDNPLPDGSRARVRENFPSDYTFVTRLGPGVGHRIESILTQKLQSFGP